jgi:hypothetical protein
MQFCKLVSELQRNTDVAHANVHFLSLIIFVQFFILIVFVSSIFHLQSILAINYLMSHILDAVFNFLLNCVLLFLQQCAMMSHRLDAVFNFLLNCVLLFP